MEQIKRENLVEKIHEAFKDTPAPKNGYVGYELEEFKQVHWRDVPVELIRKYRDSFGNFSPEGFRFYLPAILTAIILQPKIVDTAVNNIIFYVSPPELDEPFNQGFDLRVKEFCQEEKQAISLFLNSYRELEPYGWWTTDETYRMKLDRAIDFWRNSKNYSNSMKRYI